MSKDSVTTLVCHLAGLSRMYLAHHKLESDFHHYYKYLLFILLLLLLLLFIIIVSILIVMQVGHSTWLR